LTINETYLFEQIKSGDKSAFDKAFRLYYQDLCRFGMFMSCSSEDSEELVQDLFFKIWQNRKSITINSSLKSYLFSAIRNSIANKFKHERIKQQYIQSSYNEDYAPDSSEILENDEKGERINAVINQLPEKRRKIFILSKIEGYKYKEIAEKLEISVKTVENQMGEALKFLRENLVSNELIILIIFSAYLLKYQFLIGVFNNLIV